MYSSRDVSLPKLDCICCGSDRFTVLVQGTTPTVSHSPLASRPMPEFRVLKCLDCGMGITDPGTVADLGTDPSRSKPLPEPPVIHTDDIAHVASSIYRADRLRPYLTSASKVLEIGCSTGKLVELVQQQGVAESIGIEISPPEVAYALRCQRPIKTTYLQECQFADGYFDIIQAHHVLEHIPNLLDVLAEIQRILKPGGLLYLTVPRYTSWFARSSSWMGWFPEEHFWHFTERTLTHLLSRYGFQRMHYCCPLTNNFLTRQNALATAKRALKAVISAANLGDTVEAMFVKH